MAVANATSIHKTTAVIVADCETTASRDLSFSPVLNFAFEVFSSSRANRADAMFRFARVREDLKCNKPTAFESIFPKTFGMMQIKTGYNKNLT